MNWKCETTARPDTYDIATVEYPGAKGLNLLSLWDLHWVKELDDVRFSDQLVDSLQRRA